MTGLRGVKATAGPHLISHSPRAIRWQNTQSSWAAILAAVSRACAAGGTIGWRSRSRHWYPWNRGVNQPGPAPPGPG